MGRNIFRRWLRRNNLYTGKINRIRYYEERHLLPDVPKANEIAVAGTAKHPKWLLIDCPCGNGHTVLLPLSKMMNPSWSLTLERDAGPYIFPSIDRNRDQGSRCHYWIKNGEVRWV